MRIVEGVGEVFEGGGGAIGGRCFGHAKFGGEEVDGVGAATFSCGGNVNLVVAIVLGFWANIPTVATMVGPCTGALGFLLVDDCLHAARCEGRCVEIEVSENLGVGGQFWVDSGFT